MVLWSSTKSDKCTLSNVKFAICVENETVIGVSIS